MNKKIKVSIVIIMATAAVLVGFDRKIKAEHDEYWHNRNFAVDYLRSANSDYTKRKREYLTCLQSAVSVNQSASDFCAAQKVEMMDAHDNVVVAIRELDRVRQG